MKKQIILEFDDDELAHLSVLAFSRADELPIARAKEALEHLAHSAIDGVRRPGSWERGWLYHAFGQEFETKLEQHPEVRYYQRPKR